MRRAGIVTAALLLTPLLGLVAQAAPYVSAGQRIRLKTNPASSWIVGTLLEADDDSLRLRVAEQVAVLSIARDAVSQLEVYWRHSSAGKGALIGFGVGAPIGAILGATRCHGGFLHWSAGSCAAAGAAFAGGAGALVGAIIGSASHSDGWTTTSIDRIRLTVAPGDLHLALSLTF